MTFSHVSICNVQTVYSGSKNEADIREKECNSPSFYVTQASALHNRGKDTNVSGI